MTKPPNVLYIFADDLGPGDVSCFNEESRWTTPHLDRLASEGMRLTDSHATSAVCTPSRYSLLTGRYNWRSRLKRQVLPGDSQPLIEKGRLTLPMFLQEAGYKTAVVGKWHLGLDWVLKENGNDYDAFGVAPADDSKSQYRFGRYGDFDPANVSLFEGLDIDYSQRITFGPNELGFDYSFITAASLDQPPYVYIENGQPLGIPTMYGGDKSPLDRRTDAEQTQIQKGPMVQGYDITRVVPDFQEKALQTLRVFLEQEDPWFLYVPSHLVHGPIIPNSPWKGRSGAGPYGDFVLQFDEYVGQLVELLDQFGVRDNTIVFVTSDNGASGVAGLDTLRQLGHDPSNGWRGHKSDIWEGGHRAPSIVRWPDKIKPGTVNENLVSHGDLFATLAQVLERPIPTSAAEDSISNLSLWVGDDEPVRTEVVSHSVGGGLSLRQGGWKLIFATTGDGIDAMFEESQGGEETRYIPAQLYDLSIDPSEGDNLIDRYPQRVVEMQKVLEKIIRRGRSTPGPDRPNDLSSSQKGWIQIDWASEASNIRQECTDPENNSSVLPAR